MKKSLLKSDYEKKKDSPFIGKRVRSEDSEYGGAEGWSCFWIVMGILAIGLIIVLFVWIGILTSNQNSNTSVKLAAWVVGGTSETCAIAYSLDGANYYCALNQVFSRCNNVAYAADISMWVAVGVAAVSGGPSIAWSTDGIRWYGTTTAVFDSGGLSVDWSSTQHLFVAGGSSVSNNPVLYTSPDGQTWTRNTQSILNLHVNDITYSKAAGLWIAVGKSNSTAIQIMTATDPTGTWSSRGGQFSTEGFGVLSSSVLSRILIMGGVQINETALAPFTTVSFSGLGFVPFGSASTATAYSASENYVSGKVIIGGTINGIDTGPLVSTLDMVTFTNVTISNLGMTTIRDIEFSQDSGVWTLVGSSTANSYTVAYSINDGQTWFGVSPNVFQAGLTVKSRKSLSVAIATS